MLLFSYLLIFDIMLLNRLSFTLFYFPAPHKDVKRRHNIWGDDQV